VPDGRGLPAPPAGLETWIPESQSVSDRAKEKPVFQVEQRSSFVSEMKGCLWSALMQLLLILFCFLLLKFLMSK